MPEFKAAAVQMRSGTSVEKNIRDAERLIREAAAARATYVLTPEMTNILALKREHLMGTIVDEDDDKSLAAFRALARKLGIYLHVGSLAIKVSPDKAANRSFLIGRNGEIVARYDKIHMFDVQLNAGNIYKESDSFAAGAQAVVANLAVGALGMTVCYDVRFPDLYRQLAWNGAKIIAVPAAFTRITGEAHWHILLRSRAIETGCFVIAPAQGGKHEDGRETYGHSLIIDPWGQVLAEGGTEPGVIFATLDLSKVDEVRGKIPSLKHVRDFLAPDT
jgi:deaminated glutathione amidase